MPSGVEICHQDMPFALCGPASTVPIVPVGMTATTWAEVPGADRKLSASRTCTVLPMAIEPPAGAVAVRVGVLVGVRVTVGVTTCSMRYVATDQPVPLGVESCHQT